MVGTALDKGLKSTSDSKNVWSQKIDKYSVQTVQVPGGRKGQLFKLQFKVNVPNKTVKNK